MNTEQIKTEILNLNTISEQIRYCKNLNLTVSQTKTLLSELLNREFRYQHIRNVYKQELKKTTDRTKQTAEEILNEIVQK